MAFIDWQREFETGVDSVDRQHKRLVELINSFDDAVANHRGSDELGRILGNLADYTRYHFSEEEKLMLANEFDEYDKHCEQHQEFVSKLTEFVTEWGVGDMQDGERLLAYLKEWLLFHILNEDMKLKSFSEVPVQSSEVG